MPYAGKSLKNQRNVRRKACLCRPVGSSPSPRVPSFAMGRACSWAKPPASLEAGLLGTGEQGQGFPGAATPCQLAKAFEMLEHRDRNSGQESPGSSKQRACCTFRIAARGKNPQVPSKRRKEQVGVDVAALLPEHALP